MPAGRATAPALGDTLLAPAYRKLLERCHCTRQWPKIALKLLHVAAIVQPGLWPRGDCVAHNIRAVPAAAQSMIAAA